MGIPIQRVQLSRFGFEQQTFAVYVELLLEVSCCSYIVTIFFGSSYCGKHNRNEMFQNYVCLSNESSVFKKKRHWQD